MTKKYDPKVERSLAVMAEAALPGARVPKTKAELKQDHSPVLTIENRLYAWMGDGRPAWTPASRARVAALAWAVRKAYARVLLRVALLGGGRLYWHQATVEELDALKPIEEWGSAEPNFAEERTTAAAMLRDVANVGVGSGPVTFDTVLWGAKEAVFERAWKFGFRRPTTGRTLGRDGLRSRCGFPPIRRGGRQ